MDAIEKLRKGESLTLEESHILFGTMLDGNMEQPLIEEILALLSEKGETASEIAGAAKALQERAIPLKHNFEKLLDTCGTGGDNSGSFNISTTSAIVCSVLIPVVKHGNRAVSSKTGSADVLEALKVPINLDAQEATQFLKDKNFVFLFAQKFSPAMKFVTPARKALGKRTIFNLLGPLCNPARPDSQLIGLFRKDAMSTYVEAMEMLDIPRAMVVASHDGMDEVSLSAPTTCYLKQGYRVKQFEFDPTEFGIYANKDAVKGYEPETNARLVKETLLGRHQDLVNVVAINAAFALMATGMEEKLSSAFLLAREVITSGKAYAKLVELAS